MSFLPLIQQTIAQAAQGQQTPSLWSSLLPFVVILFIFYFLLIRPQQKKEKERQAMLASIKHDDEVITTGGMYGKVTNLTEQVVTLEVAQNVRIKVARSAIAGLKNPSVKEEKK